MKIIKNTLLALMFIICLWTLPNFAYDFDYGLNVHLYVVTFIVVSVFILFIEIPLYLYSWKRKSNKTKIIFYLPFISAVFYVFYTIMLVFRHSYGILEFLIKYLFSFIFIIPWILSFYLLSLAMHYAFYVIFIKDINKT